MANSNALQKIRNEMVNGAIHLDANQLGELQEKASKLKLKEGCLVTGKDERNVYSFLKNILLPTLQDYVMKSSPEIYEMYQGNMCRHASLVACHTLKKMLPEWNWDMYEVTYSATMYDQDYTCTHAFVVGELNNEYRAVDMWDPLGISLYVPIDSIRYPFEYDEVEENRKVISLTKLSYDDMSRLDNELLLGDVPYLLKQVNFCIKLGAFLGMFN